MDIAIQVVPAERTGQDRAGSFAPHGGHLLVVADGAGGTSGGGAAADAVVETACTFAPSSPLDCVRFLSDLDERLTTIGETTAVMVFVAGDEVWGASVGDSSAWLVSGGTVVDLTEQQRRKPLVGSGRAVPVGFGPFPLRGRLLVGTDGLFNYVDRNRILELAETHVVGDVPERLVAAARLKSGRLRDDIAVIVVG